MSIPALFLAVAVQVFAPGAVSRAGHDAAPAFTPDGKNVYFQTGNADGATIVVSHLHLGSWSRPQVAPFSGRWNDLEPALSPDGAFMVFASNRPIVRDGRPIDGFFGGKVRIGAGGNLWRMERTSGGWSEPRRLPDVINDGTSVYAPSVLRDGSILFMRPDPATENFRLYRSQWTGTTYAPPKPLPFSDGTVNDVDPVGDPDERFIIFGSRRPPADGMDLFLVMKEQDGWGIPMHLGKVINAPGSDAEPRLSPDGQRLYFSSERTVHTQFPRYENADQDVEAIAEWNNGLYNVWMVDLSEWMEGQLLDAEGPHE